MTIAEQADPRVISEHELKVRIDAQLGIAPAINVFRESAELRGMVLFGEDVDEVWDWFSANYRFVAAAGGCVTDEHLRLLAIRRLGLWDLPKGKVDTDETVEAAALREVREECGLKNVELVKRLRETWHTYERKGEQHLKRTDWYLMHASSAQELIAQQEEDISEVRWMDASGVEELKRGTYPSLLGVISAWEDAVRRPA